MALWQKDIQKWNKLPLVDKVKELRKHYCTGIFGQSMDITTRVSETDKVLKEVIKILEEKDLQATYEKLREEGV